MTNIIPKSMCRNLITTFTLGSLLNIASPIYAEGPHDYYDSLVARPDCWKKYSLRDSSQLSKKTNKGDNLWFTYDPANDKDPHAQDAAKVVIPAFSPLEKTPNLGALATLDGDLDASATEIKMKGATSIYATADRTYLIDSEKVVGTGYSKGVLQVKRAQFGTKAESHKAGTFVRCSINTVPVAHRVPLGTEDGNTYLFTWEGYWTDSYLNSGLGNHKAFNFLSNGIWLEPDTVFSGGSLKDKGFSQKDSVATFATRSYNHVGGPEKWDGSDFKGMAGPGVTGNEPVQPMLATFVIKPNRWVRFWYRIEQRKDDYDYMDAWIADEENDPVQIYKHLPLSIRMKGPGGKPCNTIEGFYFEYNTSLDLYVRGDDRDFVAYTRNFVALRNPPADLTPLLVRPLAKAPVGKSPEVATAPVSKE